MFSSHFKSYMNIIMDYFIQPHMDRMPCIVLPALLNSNYNNNPKVFSKSKQWPNQAKQQRPAKRQPQQASLLCQAAVTCFIFQTEDNWYIHSGSNKILSGGRMIIFTNILNTWCACCGWLLAGLCCFGGLGHYLDLLKTFGLSRLCRAFCVAHCSYKQ